MAISDIAVIPSFQVRERLNESRIKEFKTAYMNRGKGNQIPPLKVAKIGQAYVLIDGWHRLEALKRAGETTARVEVVYNLTEKEARWAAGEANSCNGLPYKGVEWRKLFRCYMEADRHKLPHGKMQTYEEIAAGIGSVKSPNTIRSWMKKDFPDIFERMSRGQVAQEWNGIPKKRSIHTHRKEHEGVTRTKEAENLYWMSNMPKHKAAILREMEEATERMKKDERPFIKLERNTHAVCNNPDF